MLTNKLQGYPLGQHLPRCRSALWLQLHPGAQENPEFVWAQNKRLASALGYL